MNMPNKNATPCKRDSSTDSFNESPRKCNLSFTFNFDLEAVKSDDSSDSETPDLQIDVAEVDNYEPAKKRMRIEIDEPSAINEMEEEIERQLDAKAAKTNLTATNVKNILKHVITNEHVLAMVQNRLQNTEDGMIFEPKLTRAKAKELAMKQVNMPWPITPIKKTASSEVQELIEKDLSEDSSDEEYSPPEQDQQSDDEVEGDHVVNSDLDYHTYVPVTTGDPPQTSEEETPINAHYDSAGIFKIPGIPHVPTEEESIGQRTRSKLCLSETPLEQIEQAFIPPDITTDMYDWDCEIDEDWDNFLKEFTKPLGHDAAIEDDPEADPEYNILEDKETDLLDKEELRMDKAVKVTRKELNNLVAELFEFEDMFSKTEIELPRKKKPADNSLNTVSNNSMNNCMVDLLPALAEPELPKLVSPSQANLLATQLRQHVQLMTQHFGMTYLHPELHSQSKTCKENLNSLSYLKDGSNSAFNIENLRDALKFVNDWENKLKNVKFHADYTDFVAKEARKDVAQYYKGHKYTPKFHPALQKAFVDSKALMYPQLLPHTFFRSSTIGRSRKAYLKSEEFLIALGLEQFMPFVEAKKSKFNNKKMQLMDAAQLISQHMLPCRPANAILKFISTCKSSTNMNPIKNYFINGSAPRTIHCITLDCELIAPKKQPRSLLPRLWQEFLANKHNNAYFHIKDASQKRLNLVKPTSEIYIDSSFRNPVVNMLPNIPQPNSLTKSRLNPGSAESNEEDMESGTEMTSEASKMPQLRKTTPRLAKIRSAQNMKLMSQVSGSKALSSCARVKSRAKSESSKDSKESGGSTKGDNEDEIAELMLASTTIKKDTANRKKAKQARELENIKRLLEAENPAVKEERATKYAASFLQKLHVTFESSNPDLFRTVCKLYSEYQEKLENINQSYTEDIQQETGIVELSVKSNERKEKDREARDLLAIQLHKDFSNILRDYPIFCADALLFLEPHQAAIIDKSIEHMMLTKMNTFMNVAQTYFAKQPSRLAKVMQAITQVASDPYITLDGVRAAIHPVLKGHSLVMDMFLQVLPTEKPPDSLFAAHLFENLTCPMGPYDKHKVYMEDSPELYENIELPMPTSQEDPYGGDNCKCECHDSTDPNLKTVTEHCVSCGTRFLNGRIYLQTSEGLRPAKITFPGDDEEKLENIARVSLKTTERFIPAPSTSRRRKSSKNEQGLEESSQKQYPAKISPIKESDDGEKSTTKSRRGAKSPPKTGDQRKLLKLTENTTNFGPSVSSGVEPTSPLKSKRETRAERREAKLESKNTGIVESVRSNEFNYPGMSDQNDESDVRGNKSVAESSDSDMNISSEHMDISPTKSEGDTTTDPEDPTKSKSWTRHEDMILLQHIQKDYSETSFATVSEMLGDRTVEQVKKRCQTLLSLLEKMI